MSAWPCMARSTDDFLCTKGTGHPGTHVAMADDVVCATWGEEAAYERALRLLTENVAAELALIVECVDTDCVLEHAELLLDQMAADARSLKAHIAADFDNGEPF